MPMKRIALLGVILCFGAAPAAAQKSEPKANPIGPSRSHDLSSNLTLLLKWWPGAYDNHEQIVRQSGGGLSSMTSVPFHRVHTNVREIVAPALGEHVVSVVSYANGDPKAITRSELGVLTIDGTANAIRVKRYTDATGVASDDPARVVKLQPGDLRSLGPACDLLLRYVGDQFQGGLASKICAAKAGNSEYEIVVGARHVWERDQGRDPRKGTVAWELAPGAGFDWFQESRARPFTCHVFEDAHGEMAKTRFLTTLHLDNQGTEADMAWPDGRTLTFSIHTRAFTSSSDREYPLFRIHEKGNPVPIAYAYGVDGTTRFGLNLGWFYIRCYDDADAESAGPG